MAGLISKYKMSTLTRLDLGKVSLNNQYQVHFAGFNGNVTRYLRFEKRINNAQDFISREAGLLCSDAVLPGSAMATVNTAGDYQGVIERFAHTRNFTEVNFDFYVDNDYKSLRFLEHWMEFISSGSGVDPSGDTYYFKMRYPDEYKSNDTRIVKFEKNHFQFIEYRFIGLFPKSINSTRVSYQNSQVLKATCNFSYDRYIAGETTSFSFDKGTALNNADYNLQKSQFTSKFGLLDQESNRYRAIVEVNLDLLPREEAEILGQLYLQHGVIQPPSLSKQQLFLPDLRRSRK